MNYLKLLFISLLLLSGAIMAFSAEMTRDEKILEAKKHFSFAVQNQNINNLEEAKVQFEKSLALYDSIYQVEYLYGELLLKMEKKEEAKIAFKKSLALNPEHFNSASMLAKIHYEKGDYDSSLAMYEYMHTLKPDDSRILASVAGLKEYLGKGDEALEDYIKLIEAGQNSFDNLMKAAELAYKQGSIEKSCMYADIALSKEPDNINALSLAGKVNLEQGNLKTASFYYRKLAEIDSTSVDIITKLEDIYRAQSDRQNLVWALKRHHKLDPEDIKILGELSEVLYSLEELYQGVEYVKKGLVLNSKDGRFHILMGENYRALGQINKALEEFRLALNDENWKSSAQRLIWQIEKPESAEEKKEREFFERGKK